MLFIHEGRCLWSLSLRLISVYQALLLFEADLGPQLVYDEFTLLVVLVKNAV